MSGQQTLLILLGFPTTNSGTVSSLLKSRLDTGVKLYQQKNITKIIVTGGAISNKFVEAEVMASYCIKNGVETTDIIIEPNAKNTFENARLSFEKARYINYTDTIIVTSEFHTKRTHYFFSRYFKDITVIAAPYPANYPTINKLFLTLKERIILPLYHLGLLDKYYAIR